jgi:AcrR family transcriptional regulator
MATTRLTAAERREAVLEAALAEFATHGYHGSSTEQIARRVGISQPYVFRLFGTKRNLFKAALSRCLGETLEAFERAAAGKRGQPLSRRSPPPTSSSSTSQRSSSAASTHPEPATIQRPERSCARATASWSHTWSGSPAFRQTRSPTSSPADYSST